MLKENDRELKLLRLMYRGYALALFCGTIQIYYITL